jgi:hypothetical protein
VAKSGGRVVTHRAPEAVGRSAKDREPHPGIPSSCGPGEGGRFRDDRVGEVHEGRKAQIVRDCLDRDAEREREGDGHRLLSERVDDQLDPVAHDGWEPPAYKTGGVD